MAGRVGPSSFPQEINPSITGNAFLDTLIDAIRSFIRRFLPCLWQGDTIPSGPMAESFINERVAQGKECLQQMLRPDDTLGITPSLIQSSKAIVLIKYNNVTEVAFAALNGTPSLESLKQRAIQKLESVVRAHREAHLTELTIDTKIYFGLRQIYTGERSHYYESRDKFFRFKPDNSCTSGDGSSSTTSFPESATKEYFVRNIPSPQIRAGLERFLFP